jgi:integrase/recombinase XerD
LDWSLNTTWNDVTARQVGLFKQHLLEELKLAPASINRNLSTLKNFFSWMVDTEYMLKNPAKTISLEKLVEPEAEDLTKQEVDIIYQAIADLANSERNLALLSILLHGLRASEVSALNLEDYDGKRIHIRKAKSDSKGYVLLVESAIAHIDNYLQMRQDRGEILTKESPILLSHSNRSPGSRLTYSGIHDVIASLKVHTGIYLHPHRFRHTYITELVLLGMDTYHIMTLSRHKSTQSFRRYTKRGDQVAAENAFFAIKKEDSN